MEAEESVEKAEMSASERRQGRHRNKKICKQVLEQIQFYFSDSNLHKDRFLMQLIRADPDGWVLLEKLLTFNKLRSMTTEENILVKALKHSETLELSDDRCRVRRKFPLCHPGDIDARTIYVDNLPSGITHDWVKQQFAPYGNVAYVSLPRYKSTRDLRGFAFVEFSTEDEAENACEDYQSRDAARAMARVGKSKQFTQLELRAAKRKRGTSESGTPFPTAQPRKRLYSDSIEQPKKRYRRTSEGEDHREGSAGVAAVGKRKRGEKEEEKARQEVKKAKTTDKDTASDARPTTSGDLGCVSKDIKEMGLKNFSKSGVVHLERGIRIAKKGEREAVRNEPIVHSPVAKQPKKNEQGTGDKAIDTVGMETKESTPAAASLSGKENEKKKKTRKKKSKNKREQREQSDLKKKEATTTTTTVRQSEYQLQVISKAKWLELKKSYLKEQTRNMRRLKVELQQYKEETQAPEKEQPAVVPEAKTRPRIKFAPKVILKVECDEPITRKQLKETLSDYGEVAYIDLIDGDLEAFVRCKDSSNADRVLEAQLAGYSFQRLEDQDEQDYWQKILADQHRKFNEPKPKKRGREKILSKAQKIINERRKHVFFDDIA